LAGSRPISRGKHPPFEFAVVDESQDVSVAQLKFLAALGGGRPNSLFFAGDLGQRIFQQAFSWKSLGVDVRGRSTTLHINYRTSHQIRMQADRLLGPAVADVDGNTEERRGTVSIFNGPPPDIRVSESPEDEIDAVAQWLSNLITKEGIKPHEIGIFVRSATELNRARQAVEKAGLVYKMLDEHVETTHGYTSIGTMHLAKGLEFRAVAVMACDDEVRTTGLISPSLQSTDGGFGFQGPDDTSFTNSKADAYRADVSVGLSDFVKGHEGRFQFYTQRLDAGYSAPGQLTIKRHRAIRWHVQNAGEQSPDFDGQGRSED
jgi:superfamily I DNA/RNA helicase